MRGALAFVEPARAPARIINHDIMGCTAEGVVGNHLYSGRALGLTEPGDLLQLHPDLRSQWTYIRDHYRRIGLSHTEQIIWDVGQDVLSRYPEREVCVFYFGAGEHRVRPDAAWFRAVDFINSKNNFMFIAQRLGVPVPETLCFGQASDISDRQIETFPHPCYLKAAVSVSGVGIYRCGDATALRTAIGRFEPGVPVQLQQAVTSDHFLNLQYQVTADGLERLAVTEQILDGCAHQGNRFPALHEPWECVEPMAEWLYWEGMKGTFAFDVAVTQKSIGTDYLAIECNPRFNGASYPTVIAHKLGLESWVARVFSTRHRSLTFLQLAGIEYNPHRGEGVVLVNWGPILKGKLLCLVAGSEAVQERLILELERRL